MKFLVIIASLICVFHLTAMAHPGGHGEGPQMVAECNSSKGCSSEEARAGGERVIKFLNDTYRLPTEWREIVQADWTKQMEYEKESVWVNHFYNSKMTEPKDQNLYVVISNQGFLIGISKDISKLKELTNYNWIIGIGIILSLAVLALITIRYFERKKEQ
jgi:hypothetical protein